MNLRKVLAPAVVGLLLAALNAQPASADTVDPVYETFADIVCSGPTDGLPWQHLITHANGIEYDAGYPITVILTITGDDTDSFTESTELTPGGSSGSWSTATYYTGEWLHNHNVLNVSVYNASDRLIATARDECYYEPPARP